MPNNQKKKQTLSTQSTGLNSMEPDIQATPPSSDCALSASLILHATTRIENGSHTCNFGQHVDMEELIMVHSASKLDKTFYVLHFCLSCHIFLSFTFCLSHKGALVVLTRVALIIS